MRHRRITILALVMATIMTLPGAALAADDAGDLGETDRATVTESGTDRATTGHRLFERAKQRALDAVAARLRVVEGLGDEITASRFITEQHAGMLRGDLARTEAGLEKLERQIEATETWAELRPLLGQIDDWKVFGVLAPKTHQVITSDAMVAAAGKLTSFADKLGSVIERFEQAGHDVDEAWRLLEEMEGLTSEGLRLADPVAENVIGLDPEDWPDPAQAVLADGRSDLRQAGDTLQDARRTAVEIVRFLRGL